MYDAKKFSSTETTMKSVAQQNVIVFICQHTTQFCASDMQAYFIVNHNTQTFNS